MTTSASQKALVITGGSKGIGLATARYFQERDYRVVNISRSPTPLAGAVQISVDLSRPGWQQEAEAPLAEVLADVETIALVHNGALKLDGAVDEVSEDAWQQMLAVNILAPAVLNRLLIGRMSAGSSIIYLGSTLSLKAIPNNAPYVTCKHAVVGLMRSTCQDLAGKEIHSACVCPGFTDTEMLREFAGEAVPMLAARSAMNRLVHPDEIARTIHFCATEPVLNGAIIRADLGLIEQ